MLRSAPCAQLPIYTRRPLAGRLHSASFRRSRRKADNAGESICYCGGTFLVGASPLPAQTVDQGAITAVAPKHGADDAPRKTTTGSLISRPDDGGHRPVASTGLGGTAGTSSGIDPFQSVRKIKITDCKASGAVLSKTAACELAKVQTLIESGAYEEARAALDRLQEVSELTAEDRFAVHRFAYTVAELEGDPLDRERAFEAMLSSGLLPEADRPSAMRSLVVLALKRGDDTAAIARLERLRAAVPNDAQSRANLATLYSRAGRDSDAVQVMREAIAVAEHSGQTVPVSWTDYVRDQIR